MGTPSDGFGCLESSRPAGRPAPTPLAASLFEGGLADGLTRRAILGAAVAVPVAAAAGEVSVRSSPASLVPEGKSAPRKWIIAVAAYCWAEADLKGCDQRTSRASAGPQGRSFDEQEALDEEYSGFVEAAEAAMLRLLEAPAPDLEALAMKIGLIAKHLVWELEGGEDCLVWLEADARRLAAQEK